ncbi:uncharacterized protein [Neodiprion pinetum]|uniref:uncharacterized protein LOC124183406 n=1 Tax=Neodiprion fabricii TaxID=2872261 RepID=UPI001ED8EB87|nr:uncharacterized protein LOC124183406 [Neodiprion fabricii]XP_046484653.1 uncharacterized protein LOC124220182 [Neodiprion pinetum]XP_046621863.1 uncharacterized protein LOC124305908 [Neodiprion virginianus]
MASLVADYGTSSGSESDVHDSSCSEDSDDNICKEEEKEDEENGVQEDIDYDMNITTEQTSRDKLPLPTPDFNVTPTLKTSVFSNPFVEAEKAKSAILEKHVKMTPTLDDTKMINGKKICWNYRKGRCRFGHNCTFAHDSDLHRSAIELESARAPQETLICQTQYNGQATFNEEDEVDQENNQTHKRKKRPGLTQNLVPGKKVMKMYKAQQTKTITR